MLRKEKWIFVKAGLVILVLLSGCTPIVETATEMAATVPVVIEPTLTPEPTATSTPTSMPRADDPATWDLAGMEIYHDEDLGYRTYALEEWQYQPPLEVVKTVFNMMYGESNHLVTPAEAEPYYDTSAAGWLGDDSSLGFLEEYEHNNNRNGYLRFSYSMSNENTKYFSDWTIHGLQQDLSKADPFQVGEIFTVVIGFTIEEQPLYTIDKDTQEVLNVSEFFGPFRYVSYLQYQESAWKIIKVFTEDLGS